jgi:hypothetical protein
MAGGDPIRGPGSSQGRGSECAAVAALAARLADEHGAGRDVPLGDW